MVLQESSHYSRLSTLVLISSDPLRITWLDQSRSEAERTLDTKETYLFLLLRRDLASSYIKVIQKKRSHSIRSNSTVEHSSLGRLCSKAKNKSPCRTCPTDLPSPALTSRDPDHEAHLARPGGLLPPIDTTIGTLTISPPPIPLHLDRINLVETLLLTMIGLGKHTLIREGPGAGAQ